MCVCVIPSDMYACMWLSVYVDASMSMHVCMLRKCLCVIFHASAWHPVTHGPLCREKRRILSFVKTKQTDSCLYENKCDTFVTASQICSNICTDMLNQLKHKCVFCAAICAFVG